MYKANRKGEGDFMRKRHIVTAVGVLSSGLVASYLLSKKENRNMVKGKMSDFKNGLLAKRENEYFSVLEEAGIPDQLSRIDLAQIENAKMVSEGSQYGVNYYNEVQDRENMEMKH